LPVLITFAVSVVRPRISCSQSQCRATVAVSADRRSGRTRIPVANGENCNGAAVRRERDKRISSGDAGVTPSRMWRNLFPYHHSAFG